MLIINFPAQYIAFNNWHNKIEKIIYNFFFYFTWLFIRLEASSLSCYPKCKHLICQLLSILYKQLCLLQIINCFHKSLSFGFSFFNCHPLTIMKTSLCCYWKYFLHWYLTLWMLLISSSNKKIWSISNATCVLLLVCVCVCVVYEQVNMCALRSEVNIICFLNHFSLYFWSRHSLNLQLIIWLDCLALNNKQGLCASTSQCWHYRSITPRFPFT